MRNLIVHSTDNRLLTKLATSLNIKLVKHNTHYRAQINHNIDLKLLRKKYRIDINILPHKFDISNIKLFAIDMDSTLITIECIDEMADFIGLKKDIAAVTKDAMAGNIDFDTALKQRVALFSNMEADILAKVYQQKLKLSPGSEALIKFLKSKNIKIALVSGGFDFFTLRLRKKLALDYSVANKLAITNNKITGKILGNIINAKAKADFISKLTDDNKSVIACGDGANDIVMMKMAGLSVAYHAKKKVNNIADVSINYSGLDKIIDLWP